MSLDRPSGQEQAQPAGTDLHAAALACLMEADVAAKLQATSATAARIREGLRAGVQDTAPARRIPVPGRPPRPRLVPPRELPQRGLGSEQGRAAFIHAIAHIEFNAINLAWDAVYRFRGMPPAFYLDWATVAEDEARHFALLQDRLAELGHRYGDFDAHDGLWDMALRTDGDCMARMALVPRVLEARGLDVTPAMIERLRGLGDARSVEILELILREEVAHVAAGTRWFGHCCQHAGLPPGPTFAALLREHAGNALRGPFNHAARRAAGFSDEEMEEIAALAR